jgi:cytochrome c biogenesis protein CcmG, thiol:disulfide interchange protein DsbE
MKKVIIVILLILTLPGYGQNSLNFYKQTILYKVGTEPLLDQKEIGSYIEYVSMSIPKSQIIKPVIYHRVQSNDTIINYLVLSAIKNDEKNIRADFEFKQDSLYLLLNKKLPEFNLTDINGKMFSSVKLIGKPTLINIWGIYCTGCVAEIEELNKLEEKYKGDVNFIAISIQDEGVSNFLKRKPFNFIQLINGDKYLKDLHNSSMPRNIFLDKDGYVREIQGELSIVKSNSPFAEILDKLIKQ